MSTTQNTITNEEIKDGFNQMIQAAAASSNLEAVSRLELAREYFTNPAFKAALEQYVWGINQTAR